METPPGSPAGAGGRRAALRIPLAAVVVAALLVAAVFGGYAIGRARQGAQRPPGTVSASFVTLRLAPGWKVVSRSPDMLDLANDSGDSISVQRGSSRQDRVAGDADVFRNQLLQVSERAPLARVGSCLPVTPVTVGGRRGEEAGLLYRQRQPVVQDDCELIWADVRGATYDAWYSLGGTAGLSKRLQAMEEMQRTAVWTGGGG